MTPSMRSAIESFELESVRRTLFACREGTPGSVPRQQIGVWGAPSDWTQSSRIGARFGPRALRSETSRLACQMAASFTQTWVDAATEKVWQRLAVPLMVDCGDAAIDPKDVDATTRAIADGTKAIVLAGGIPLVLGGDHYNSYPACLGYSEGLAVCDPGTQFGYIHIDGHLDFTDSLGAWGDKNHATNARRISELPNIRTANMVWIGTAGWVDSREVAQIEGMGGKVFSCGDVHRLGAAAVMRAAIAHATRGVSHLYATIDIDAMDAAYLPGTGSIVQSGITPRQYNQMLEVLATAPCDGLDIAETAPTLDPSGRSERIVARMLFTLLRRYLMNPL